VCFDHKPRIISKTNKDDLSLCSHPVTKHDFEDHKYVIGPFTPFEWISFTVESYLELCEGSRHCCPVCLAGAWSTFWRRIRSVIPKSDPWVLTASWIFVGMKSATAAWERTTASTPTASSSSRSGCCSTGSVRRHTSSKTPFAKRVTGKSDTIQLFLLIFIIYIFLNLLSCRYHSWKYCPRGKEVLEFNSFVAGSPGKANGRTLVAFNTEFWLWDIYIYL